MQDLTTGSLTGHLLKTTSFMLVSMVFQTLYVLIDLYWVGRLGTDAVAAVGLSGNLMFVVLAATQMLGVGTTTLVSHSTGARNRERANLVFGWIFAGHQLGAGVAAFGAGLSRTVLNSYLPAFFVAGALCMVAALIVLMISRPKPVVAAA